MTPKGLSYTLTTVLLARHEATRQIGTQLCNVRNSRGRRYGLQRVSLDIRIDGSVKPFASACILPTSTCAKFAQREEVFRQTVAQQVNPTSAIPGLMLIAMHAS